MATDYIGAVRSGTMAASRLHIALDSKARMRRRGGGIDVFNAACELDLPLLLRPLDGLLGAYLSTPTPGIMVTTKRPLSIQRFTAAHELGHFRMKHSPSLDDENILRRMTPETPSALLGPDMQEVEADAFAANFLMPQWLIQWHCDRQKWLIKNLEHPQIAYQLSLRLGVSYTALAWTLQRYRLISTTAGNVLRQIEPRNLKAEFLGQYRPPDYRGDVWLLTERDADTCIAGSRNDLFVLRLHEHSGGGYLWNIDQLKASGFAIISDARVRQEEDDIGGAVVRNVTAALDEGRRGELLLDECRPWQPSKPITRIVFDYDFTGPEEAGLSHAAQRQLLEAA